ncbi:nucleotide sugar dehydrogenase [Nocardioides guangzhouensis]|uniref:Nucleotide sugar dehydrogenase n=1 Tax=Nocardioides guangzhouensis TaxID=2497878 RepID=A0A4V1XZS6_9ACTN|nr:nucleotide sugar dehydrogenase [Nocardioides guangzhouensis]RYP87779.1 nucleotide sugar dehydrogenase [Nocardioides guangzhouensis]
MSPRSSAVADALRQAPRLPRNSVVAASAVRRLVARRGGVAPGALQDALAALAAGELSTALAAAGAVRGPRGRLLAAYVAGELGALSPDAGAPQDRAGRDALRGLPDGRPLRVLHLATNTLPEVVAGYTVRTQGIVRAQRGAGIDAHVATRLGFPAARGHLGAPARTEVDGVPYHRTLGVVPLRADAALARDVVRSARLVERLRPDVLHAHSAHPNGQVAIALGRRYGVPVVYEVRGFVEETRRSADGEQRRSEAWRLARRTETWCMREADAVVTLATTMRDEVVARGIDPVAVTVSPNAVPDAFLADDLEPVAWPGRATGEVIVGVVGTLNHYEGIDVLVRAVARVPGVRLLVVGDGPARTDLETASRGLPVTFVGRVPAAEVARWHAAIDVYCVPRLDLPVTRLVPPLKPVEAMAVGRPVVASDLPPLRELVGHEETGLLVPPGDADALAGALRRLAGDPGLRHRLGARGRAVVAGTRTWSAAADRYADLYARLLAPAQRDTPERTDRSAPTDRPRPRSHRMTRTDTRTTGDPAEAFPVDVDLVVLGLGYVGMPLAGEAARAGLRVVGYDVSRATVDSLNAGRSHIDDLGDDDVQAMLDGGFRATTDPEVLTRADVAVVCVPTPLSKDGGPDLGPVRKAMTTVAAHLHPDQLVVLESTTYPGTTDEVVRPILESASGLTAGTDFALAFSPERIDPGNPEFGLRNTPKVVGGHTPGCTARASAFYGKLVEQVVEAAGTAEAETAKLLENTYRHINIALVNEMARFCHELGVDLWDVIRCASTKPFGFQAFFPGPGVGGHCIPIDPNYLSHSVRARLGYPFRFVELAQEINATMPAYVARRAQNLLNEAGLATQGARVLLLGVTYKPDITDQRESPAVPLARQLAMLGAEVRYHDPHVPVWDAGIPVARVVDLDAGVPEADLVVLVQNHATYDVDALARASSLFLDTRGVTTGPEASRL